MSAVPKDDEMPALRAALRPSANDDWVVDAIEELLRFTCVLRDRTDYLADRKASFTLQDQL
jgi:hypothetical protein